jgi:L-lactate dehydrogenase complex protein LldE
LSTGSKEYVYSVGLFVTCLADLLRPQVGFAAAQLLEGSGCRVTVPCQSCCGQPAYNSGDNHKARNLARKFIEQFESFDYVVAPSGSCVGMVKIHYPGLLQDDPAWSERANELAAKTWELSQFLVEVLNTGLTLKHFSSSAGEKVCYHDSCSGLRELGIRTQPRELLQRHCGLNINEIHNAEICCGFGGTFCVKYPEISTRLVDNKIDGIEQAKPDIVLGGDLGCLMNIAGRMKRANSEVRVYHYAELLAAEDPGPGIGDPPE